MLNMGTQKEFFFVFTLVFIICGCFMSLTNFVKTTMKEEDLFDININVEQDDPILINYIRKNHILRPPPQPTKPNLSRQVMSVFPLPSPANQHLLRLLKNKSMGFFVECGAYDGEFLSNSLGLEVIKGWTGLLLEGSPTDFSKLVKRNRNAWLANICLSESRPEKFEFVKHNDESQPGFRVENGRTWLGENNKESKKPWREIAAYHSVNYISGGILECIPMYSVLSAINITHVDFLSLDVGGNEFRILKGFPFHLVNVDVILVAFLLAPEGKKAFVDLMTSRGYLCIHQGPTDLVFSRVA